MQEQGGLPPVNAGICLTAEFNEMRGSWRGSGVATNVEVEICLFA